MKFLSYHFFLGLLAVSSFYSSSLIAQINSYDPRNASTSAPAAPSFDYSAVVPQNYIQMTLTMGATKQTTLRANPFKTFLFGYRLNSDNNLIRRRFEDLPGRISLKNQFSNAGNASNSTFVFDPRKLAKGFYFFYFTYITSEGDERTLIYRVQVI